MARFLATLCSLLLAASIQAGMRPATAEDSGELTIGITQFPSTLNPLIDSMLAKSYVVGMTRRPINIYDQNWDLVCLICTDMPTIENGKAVPEPLEDGGEGIAVTYTLLPNIAWGDGTPVTTADVVFTWEVGRHDKTGAADFEIFRRILSIDAQDDKTFTAHIDRITYDYNALNRFELLPAHIERPLFEADPVEYRNRTTFDTDPTNPALYFGPYRIAEVETGAHIVLEPNPTWPGRAPAFSRITVRIIENTAALEANLLSGAIDMVSGELGFTIDQALAFEKRHGAGFKVVYKPGLIYEHIDLNLDNPILQDKRVRQALIQGIDRAALSEQLFGGRQPVAHASVSPLDWVHDPKVPRYAYDPEAAAALLQDAGWTEIKDGIRHNAAGERLSLDFGTTAANRSRELVQQVLQSQWRQIGVETRIKNQPARVFFGETVTKRDFGALAMFAWSSAPEHVPRTTLHSEQVPTAENNWAGQNYTGFKNAEMDRLIEAIEVELDRPERKLLWRDLQRLYIAELPVIPLYWRANAYILPKWLKGVRPTGHQHTTTLWVEQWRREGG